MFLLAQLFTLQNVLLQMIPKDPYKPLFNINGVADDFDSVHLEVIS